MHVFFSSACHRVAHLAMPKLNAGFKLSVKSNRNTIVDICDFFLPPMELKLSLDNVRLLVCQISLHKLNRKYKVFKHTQYIFLKSRVHNIFFTNML